MNYKNSCMFLDFIRENFFYLHPGYTVFNTIIFGIVLGLIVIVIIKFFEKINRNPKDLFVVLVPIIFFGSTSRALVDNHVYPRIHLLATPGIYIVIGIATIALILVSILVEKKTGINYTKTILFFGSFLSIPNMILIIMHGFNYHILIMELLIFLTVSLPFIMIRNRIRLLNSINLSVLLAHILDATSTFVAMDFYNYSEQHVLPTFFINIFDTAIVMYPIKIISILILLFVIDKFIEDDVSNNMLKLAIFILGLAPALRNITTLILSII